MVTEDGLYDEFAAALQSPHYFGGNGDALSECLADLSWLSAQSFMELGDALRGEPNRFRLRQRANLAKPLRLFGQGASEPSGARND